MAMLGNLVWIVFGGWICALGWLGFSALMALTVVGIPFAVAGFKMANFVLFPFGRELVDKHALGESKVPGTAIANILWFFLAGIWLAIFHVIFGILLCVTVVFFPLGLAHFKLASVSLAPLGKRIVASH